MRHHNVPYHAIGYGSISFFYSFAPFLPSRERHPGGWLSVKFLMKIRIPLSLAFPRARPVEAQGVKSV